MFAHIRYLQPEASSTASCFQSIAAVHDKLGNLDEAVTYYHRARLSLSSLTVPKDERGMLLRTTPTPTPIPNPELSPSP